MTSEKMRLDRFLSEMTSFSRNEIKSMIRKGRVKVGGRIVQKPETRIDTADDEIALDNEIISWEPFVYYMMNKPAGVVTATQDRREKTVLDLISDAKRKDLFPVGRLDKDTEGLLLLTNDGPLAHFLLSPARHVAKTYLAEVERPVTDNDIRQFEEGLRIDDDWTAQPAELAMTDDPDKYVCTVTIYEGRYHQVKRMFEAVGNKVLYLKRLSMGPLELDPGLRTGTWRPLTKQETEALAELMPASEREKRK